MSKKVIVVFGATGAQGGSVVEHLLTDPQFAVRAVTRSVESEKAKALAAKGVEVVQADISDPASFAKGSGVFDGAWGTFVVTNFWDPTSMGKEEQQGKALVDAAIDCGVKHMQYAGLINAEKVSGGTIDVLHFTAKGKVWEYILSKKDAFVSAHSVAAGFYFQNFLAFFPPKVDEDGTNVFTLPNVYITGFDVRDTGGVSLALFRDPSRFDGQLVPCSGEHFSVQEFVDKYSAATGKPAKLNALTCDEFAQLGFPGAAELAEMFRLFEQYGVFANEKRELGIRLYPAMKDLDAWLETKPFD